MAGDTVDDLSAFLLSEDEVVILDSATVKKKKTPPVPRKRKAAATPPVDLPAPTPSKRLSASASSHLDHKHMPPPPPRPKLLSGLPSSLQQCMDQCHAAIQDEAARSTISRAPCATPGCKELAVLAQYFTTDRCLLHTDAAVLMTQQACRDTASAAAVSEEALVRFDLIRRHAASVYRQQLHQALSVFVMLDSEFDRVQQLTTRAHRDTNDAAVSLYIRLGMGCYLLSIEQAYRVLTPPAYATGCPLLAHVVYSRTWPRTLLRIPSNPTTTAIPYPEIRRFYAHGLDHPELPLALERFRVHAASVSRHCPPFVSLLETALNQWTVDTHSALPPDFPHPFDRLS